MWAPSKLLFTLNTHDYRNIAFDFSISVVVIIRHIFAFNHYMTVWQHKGEVMSTCLCVSSLNILRGFGWNLFLELYIKCHLANLIFLVYFNLKYKSNFIISFSQKWPILQKVVYDIKCRSMKIYNFYLKCEISSSHGGEYDVQSCLLGYTAV
jgi:hypothetical protein